MTDKGEAKVAGQAEVKSGLRACIPWFDYTNPYRPCCNCANCQLEKNCLLSVPPDSTVCLCIPSFIARIFTGAADVFLTPWLLALHYMRIYFIPAVTSTIFHLIERFICTLNCCSCGYTDYWYPPNDRTVGLDESRPHTVENLNLWHRGIFYLLCGWIANNKIEWVRAKDLSESEDSKVALFKDDIEPGDIYQGGLGDCWLLASLAAIAERHPHLLRDAFLTGRVSLCGYYKIKLFDIINGTPRWKVITIDDFIPVHTGTKAPLYSQPNNNELWVLLMEKAFSKILGSYSYLKGGFSRFPFAALTGNDPVEYKWEDSSNGHGVFALTNTSCMNEKHGATYHGDDTDAPKELVIDQMYNVVSKGLKHDLIITVAVNRGVQGLVGGHMYSVLNACTHKDVKLVQMRNPWGAEGEWTGAYSDNDPKTKGWKPDSGFVMDTLGLGKQGVENATDADGLFWMPMEDLAREAKGLFCVCAVSSSMNTVRLDMHEGLGECGPCYGAIEGGCSFCVKCQGVSHLWCPQTRSTGEMVKAFADNDTLAELMGCA